MAAETVAWWLFGGTREDWRMPVFAPRLPPLVWLASRCYVWRKRKRGGGGHG